jgi:hypothetical protein
MLVRSFLLLLLLLFGRWRCRLVLCMLGCSCLLLLGLLVRFRLLGVFRSSCRLRCSSSAPVALQVMVVSWPLLIMYVEAVRLMLTPSTSCSVLSGGGY